MHNNYHTHTSRCKHGSGAPVDYCREALKQGVQVLGFTDHCPQPDHKWQEVRMEPEELDAYFDDIRMAQALYPQLEIHAGLECEYRCDLGKYQWEEFRQHPGRCEYLLLALHSYIDAAGQWQDAWHLHDREGLLGYARFAVKALESGWFLALAHPDLFASGGCAWGPDAAECSRIILQAAQDTHTPIEINANGFRKPLFRDADGLLRRHYPYPPFWRLAAEYQVDVYVASDAHNPVQVWGNTGDCEGLAHFYGLNLIHRLPGLKGASR